MKRALATVSLACLLGTPAFADQGTQLQPSAGALLSQMRSLCRQAFGYYISAGMGSACECRVNVISFAEFQARFVSDGRVQTLEFLDACKGRN